MIKQLLVIAVFLLCLFSKAIAQNYNMGNANVSTCGGTFYDSGGNANAYSDNETSVMTFCSSTSGQCVRLTFTSFDLETTFDRIRIYNGPNTASPLLGSYTGTTSPGIVTGTSGCLTIEFTSDGSVTHNGWSATVSCVACGGGPCGSTCNGGPAPANDACSGAQNLGLLPVPSSCPVGIGTPLTLNTTNLCATAETPYTSMIGCQPAGNMASPAADVWYSFSITGPTLNVNIAGLQTPEVGLYSGSGCNNLVPRGCAIGNNGNLNTTFGSLQPGQYFLQVSGASLNDQCNFTLSLQNNFDCTGCVIQSNLTVNPPPVNGTYQAGQTVNFCYSITDYNQTSSNWLHAITPSFGAGWVLNSLSATPAVTCATGLLSGTWSWYNSSFTSTATGLTVGPGFFFETAAGNATGVTDLNPGNNFGDNNALNTCDWTFCWSITTLPPGQCIPGASLNISIDTYGDGETGSWTSYACSGDPIIQFFAQLACCTPPQITNSTINCPGGTATATATGQGIAPWNYIWRNGAGTIIQTANNINGSNTVNNLAAGTYTVTVTDDAGCTASESVTIAPAVPVTANGNVTNPSCSGANTGSITAAGAGGTGPYTYAWNPNVGSSATVNNVAPGNYTVTVTDANGCTGTHQFTVTQPTPVTATTAPTNVSCFGGSNGSAVANPSGGSGVYTYSWAPTGGSAATASNLAPGTYTVTVSDNAGCTGTATVTITQPVQVTAAITASSNVSCAGGSNGSATVSAGGGTPAYTYSWAPSGGSGATANNIPAGNFTVTVTDSRGCTMTANVAITQPTPVVPSLQNQSNVTCNGGNNGSVSAAANGGSPGYTYSWTPSGGNSSTASNLAAGNFTVTVTDANGCTATTLATITQPPTLTGNAVPVPASCNGVTDGSVSVAAGGGTGPYTYNWLPSGGTAGNATGLSAGTYTVTITDANGCTRTSTANITEPTAITYTSASTLANCGASDGTASVTPSGGTNPYSYQWSPSGGNAANASNLAAGAYAVTITDANGCTTVAAVAVSNVAGPSAAIAASADVTCFGGANGSATVTSNGGTAPFTYSWSPSGGSGLTASGLAAGNYAVTVTDALGCNASTNITINEPPQVTAAISALIDVLCASGNTGSATVLAGGGTPNYSYNWAPSGGSGATANNLSAGNYSVTVTDAAGCTSTAAITLTEPPVLTAPVTPTDITCNGAGNGSANVNPGGGVGPYSFNWSPSGGSGSSASNLNAGNYTVTVTDANGCTLSSTVVIAEPAAIGSTATPVDIICNGAANGSISSNVNGGTGPFTYAWSPSGGNAANATNLGPGNYTITITDANGCTTSASATVAEPAALTASIGTPVDVLCNGGATGSASVTAGGGSAPFTYSWSPSGGNGSTASNLTAGNYSVTISDASGCTSTAAVTIYEPTPVVTAITASTDVICNGAADGTANANANGGTGALSYTWTPTGGNTAAATALAGGTYTITATDANGCTSSTSVTINEPPAIVVNTSSTTDLCGASNGTASVNANGGTAPLTYNWTPTGGSGTTASGLTGGAYTIEVTDANGCIQRANVNVASAPSPIATASVSNDVDCFGGNNGSASVSTVQGTAPLSISWSPSGGSGASANNLSAGYYTVTVTDVNGCTSTDDVTITEPPVIALNATFTDLLCNGAADGTAQVAAAGGTPGYSYSWSPSGGNNPSATGLSGGNYTVTVTDANSCTETASVTIAEPSALSAVPASTDITCLGAANGTATVNAGGGTPTYTYAWAPSGGTSSSASGLNAATYTVTITDLNGCTTTATSVVAEPAQVTATLAASANVSCNGASDGSASVTAGGGIPGYTYTWSPSGGNAANATGLGAGTYTVSVTDANNCTNTTTAIIAEPVLLTSSITATTDVSCNGMNDGSGTVAGNGGTPNYTYSWSPSGGSGTVEPNLTAGNYTVTITDANGCTSTSAVIIAEPPLLTSNIPSSTNILCNGGADGTADVNAAGGTTNYTYSWAPSGGSGTTASALVAGTYTVTVTDANGCTSTSSVTLTEPTVINLQLSSTPSLCGNANGSADVVAGGGTSPFAYSWSPSGGATSTASNLSAGTYTVTVTDANNCTSTNTVAVANIIGPTATASLNNDVSCNGGANGSATVSLLNGTAPFNYTWSPTGGNAANATNLSAGTYTIDVIDANGCTTTDQVTISEPAALTAISSSSPALCFGNNDGSTGVVAGGGTAPYSYNWVPSGGSSANASNLSAGTYTVTVTDGNGCTQTSSAVVNQPALLTTNLSFTPALCNGSSDGTATAVPAGGTSAYAYSWFPSGGSAANASNLAAGTYSVTITDANGCTTTGSTTVTEPFAIALQTSTTPATCGTSNGTAAVVAIGGSLPYSYSWSPSGGAAANANNLPAGAFTITVTDANGCTQTDVANVSNTGGPTVAANLVQAVSCSGGNDGSANVNVANGTAPFTYSWSPSGGSGATASNLQAGNYTVDVTDVNGCISSDNVTITEPGAIAAQASSTPTLCNGSSDGSASVNVAGGTAPYSYAWSPSGGSAATATNLAAGNYTVTITDANSCTQTATTSVTQPVALNLNTTVTDAACHGSSDGSATVNVTGGTSGFTYTWFPSGGSSATASNLSAGTYTVTVTDANACTASRTANIQEPAAISLQTSSTPATCGTTNGSASVVANGGSSPYSYSWSPGNANTATASNISAGAYTVTVTDANGCTNTSVINVSNTGGPTIAASVTQDASCNGGSDGAATVNVANGTAPFTYSWSPSGGNGANATNLSAGAYSVTVHDANGCVSTDNINISEPAAMNAQTATLPANCAGSATGSASVNVAGGSTPYTYIWTPSGGAASTANGLAAGNYTVTITDANGCTRSASATVTQPTILALGVQATNASCNGLADGTATVNPNGGTPAYSYSWFPSGGSGVTANNLGIGNYSVTVTDANGCTASTSTSIQQPAAIALQTSSTPAACGSFNGSASVVANGGSAPFTYSWSPGNANTATATNLAAAAYTVTVTDANGCTNTAVANVSNTGGPTIAASVTQDVSCFGGNNGTATVNVNNGTAPFTYNWSPSGGTSATANGLPAGTFSVIVHDANGCVSTDNVTILEPNAIAAQSNSTDALCFGTATGGASVNVAGGTSPYTFAWTPSGGNAATANNLAAGNYTVTISDDNGCTSTSSTIVAQPTRLTLGMNVVPASCNGGSNGSATVNVNGGTSGFSYTWFPSGGSAATASNLSIGTYSVTVTDANGCVASQSATINQPAAMVLQTATNPANCGSSNGSASVVANGGSSPYSYSWSPGSSSSANATNLPAGAYVVTVTDANGCTSTASANITNIGGPSISASVAQHVSCFGGSNGSGTVNVSSGTAPYTYTWSPSGGIGATANNLNAGAYTVTVHDANGCVSTDQITITQPIALALQTHASDALCSGAASGSAGVNVAGGTSPYAYVWTPGGGVGMTANNLTAGTYTVTVTDANSCTHTGTASVAQPAAIVLNMAHQNASCHGAADGSASITANGGASGFSYAWFPSGGSGSAATNLLAGNYQVTVTDANGCTRSSTVTITEPAAMSVQNSSTPATCGSSNGSATVIPSGGSAPYIYSWTPGGGSTPTIGSVSAGAYTATITDANGCTSSSTVVVNNTGGPNVSLASSTNVSCAGAANGSASINVSGGTAPYVYAWSPSGGNTSSASALNGGNYTVTVTDASGCLNVVYVTISEPTAIVLQTSSTGTACGGSSGTASVLAAGGTSPFSYAWSPGGATTSTASGLSAGNYSVTITDSHSCTTTATVNVPSIGGASASLLTSTDVSCNGSANGSATVVTSGGAAPFTYSWLPSGGNAATANNLAADTYTVTVTDANGCAADVLVIINEPSAVNILMSMTPAACNGGTNGTATANASGGTPPYQYQWTPGGSTNATANNLTVGHYSVVVTDSRGCAEINDIDVTSASGIILTPAATDVSCNGGANGTASVVSIGGTPPYSYSWSPSGGTLANASGLSGGNYIVTVTDASGCTTTATATIAEPDLLSLAVTGDATLCSGQNTELEAVVTGGTGPYTYHWDNGPNSPTQTVSPLTPTTYSVSITDANGCTTNVETVTVDLYSPLSVVALGDNTLCGGTPTSISAEAAGGDGNYTYSWNNGSISGPSATVTPTNDSTFVVTVTDGCGSTPVQDLVTLIVAPAPTVAFTPAEISGCTPVHVDFNNQTVTPAGSVYSWNFGDNTSGSELNPSHDYTIPGSYTVSLRLQLRKVVPALC
ncbi:MAG: PKD domain-containing protein [Bacteroidetes bacterium]|nr:PKD domain-containing protein [Bacteroidota bacterium]